MTSPDTEFISILGASSAGADAVPGRISPRSVPEVLPVLGLSDIVDFSGDGGAATGGNFAKHSFD